MANGERLGRLPEPPHDLLSLADYRTRYAQYRRDPDLQAAHARAPWICVWDDHEVCNDTWKGGAENHHEKTEGAFQDRKANAMRAYFEWMPIREPAPGTAREAIYRSFDFGDLASLTMLESRLLARSYQLEFERAGTSPTSSMTPPTPPSAAGSPIPRPWPPSWPAPPRAARPRPPMYSALMSRLWPATSPTRTARCSGRSRRRGCRRPWQAPPRPGGPWQVVGNQVIMGRCRFPKLAPLIGEAGIAGLLAKLPESRRKEAAEMIEISRYDMPFDLDGWDGYPAARARMDAIFQAAGGGNAIVVSGDSHAFWVNQLHDAAGAQRVAVEFGTSAITSPSLGDGAGGFQLGPVFMQQNPEVAFCDQLAKGYVRLTLRHDQAIGELVQVQIDATPYAASVLGRGIDPSWRWRSRL